MHSFRTDSPPSTADDRLQAHGPKKKRCCKTDASFRGPLKTRWTKFRGCSRLREKILLQLKTRQPLCKDSNPVVSESLRASSRFKKGAAECDESVRGPCLAESPLDSGLLLLATLCWTESAGPSPSADLCYTIGPARNHMPFSPRSGITWNYTKRKLIRDFLQWVSGAQPKRDLGETCCSSV